MCRLFAVLMALCCIPTQSIAREREFILWGASHHFDPAPGGYSWNEINPGVGLRVYAESCGPVQCFAELDYIVRNSKDGSFVVLGAGVQYPLVTGRHGAFVVGVLGGVGRYENTWTDEVLVLGGAYPFIGMQHKRSTLYVGYIPKVRHDGDESSEAIFFSIGYRL